MVLLFRDFYEKSYKVPCCSCIAFVYIVFFTLVLTVPWIVAWTVGGKLSLSPPSLISVLQSRLLDQGKDILWTPRGIIYWRFDFGSNGWWGDIADLLDEPRYQRHSKLVEGRSSYNFNAEIPLWGQWQARATSIEFTFAWYRATKGPPSVAIRKFQLPAHWEIECRYGRYDDCRPRHTKWCS